MKDLKTIIMKKIMLVRLTSFALILCILSALLPAFPATVVAASSQIIVNGVELDHLDYPYLKADGKTRSKTGTLNGTDCVAYYYTSSEVELWNYSGGAIYMKNADVSWKIKLNGNNTITQTGGLYVQGFSGAAGIFGGSIGGSIEITSGGKTAAANLDINVKSGSADNNVGIYIGNSSAAVTLSGTANVKINNEYTGTANGCNVNSIYAGYIKILDDASLTAKNAAKYVQDDPNAAVLALPGGGSITINTTGNVSLDGSSTQNSIAMRNPGYKINLNKVNVLTMKWTKTGVYGANGYGAADFSWNSSDYSHSLDSDAKIEIFRRLYNVTFNKGTSVLISSGTAGVKAGYGAPMPGITVPVRSGYFFNGYYDAASGGTQYYTAGGASARAWDKTADTTLYAQWTQISPVMVTLNQNGGAGGTGSVSVQYGGSMPGITFPARTGYIFAGYWDASTGGKQYYWADGSRGNCDKTADFTLHARWTPNTYTITFDKQFGSGGTSTLTAAYDSVMPAVTTPTRMGYLFAGYYDAAAGGTQYYNASGTAVRVWNKTANTTLYARWTSNTNTITFDKQGGAGGPDIATATQGAPMPAITLPAREDYAFAGYWDAAAGGTQYYTSVGASARNWDKTVNTTLYARWTPAPKSVTVGTQSGTLIAGTAGIVTFPVTTANIANGTYKATVSNLPAGVDFSTGSVVISGGSGKLTLESSVLMPAGTTSTLTLTIDGKTSPAFTLTVLPTATKSVTVGVQIGTLVEGKEGTVKFPVTAVNVADGEYDAILSNCPAGVTVSGKVEINGFSGTLTLAGSTASAVGTTSTLLLTINGATSSAFSLTISPADVKTVTAGAQTSRVETGKGGIARFTLSVANIIDGNYSPAASTGFPAGVTVYAVGGMNIYGGVGELMLNVPAALPAGVYNDLVIRFIDDGGVFVYSNKFTLTVSEADNTPPAVISVLPGGTGAALDGSLVITFSEPMYTGAGKVWLNGNESSPLIDISRGSSNCLWTAGDTQLIIPYSGLSNNTNYIVNIGSFMDKAALWLENDWSFVDRSHSFTTVPASLTIISTAAIAGVTVPAAGGTPVTAITETAQYTGTVSWSPSVSKFDYNTYYTAIITLAPKAGYTLAGVDTNFFTVAAAANVTNAGNSGVVTAEFPATTDIPAYAVTVNSGTGGGSFIAGATVSVTANAAPEGKEFDKWMTEDGVAFANGNNASTAFTMPAKAVTVTAAYKELPPGAYAINVENDGSGTANANITSAAAGTVITLTADPFSGYRFKEWHVVSGGDITILDNKFTMPANVVTVQALFEKIPVYAVVVTDGTGDGNFIEGEVVEITAFAPPEGKAFDKWTTEDGVAFAKADSTATTFIMPAKNVTVTAVYKDLPPGTYSITVTGGTANKNYATAGETIMISANAAPAEKVFDKWITSDGMAFVNANNASTTFTMPAKNVTVTAVYKDIPEGMYAVTFMTNSGSFIDAQLVTAGDKAVKPADPVRTNSVLLGWFTDKDFTNAYDFNAAVNTNITLYAKWKWNNPFIDVIEGDWFYGNVEFVNVNNLMFGTSDTLFSPNVPLTRGMIVTVLYRLIGSPDVSGLDNPFSDVENDTWYTNAVKWGAENGIIAGYGGGLFGPDDNITRQDLAVIFARFAVFMGIEFPGTREYSAFNDEADTSDYAKDAVKKLYSANIISGKPENMFDPQGQATRAEVAAMLNRFINVTNFEL